MSVAAAAAVKITLQGGSLVSNSAGAATFAQLMARMVPALRSSLVEDIKQAAQQATEQADAKAAEAE